MADSLAQSYADDPDDNLDEAIACLKDSAAALAEAGDRIESATIQSQLGNIYVSRSRESRAVNLARAIEHYRLGSELAAQEGQWGLWAMLQYNLGKVYAERPDGERAENIDLALAHYFRALKVFTREEAPAQWHATRYSLGLAYADRLRGDRERNLRRAIRHCRAALQTVSRPADSKTWADLHNLLGLYYKELVSGDPSQHLRLALEHFEKALEVFNAEDYPSERLIVEYNVGQALLYAPGGRKDEHFQRAISYYQEALDLATRQAHPEMRARVLAGLGDAYMNLHRLTGDSADLNRRIIECYEGAAAFFTRDQYPDMWKLLQPILGGAYRQVRLPNQAESVERAIRHFEQAVELFPRAEAPKEWAGFQNELGDAYFSRIHGGRAHNIERALAHYELALEETRPELEPKGWARLHVNMSAAYLERVHGDPADNVEQAISHCQAALTVYKRETYPKDWWLVQINLGDAYLKRIHGDSEENVELAIRHFDSAAQALTPEFTPFHRSHVNFTLGNAYRQRLAGTEALNLDRAIVYYRAALSADIRIENPEEWGRTHSNLATTYTERVNGKRSFNLRKAVEHYLLAHEVFTREAHPERWAEIQNNLARAYLGFKQRGGPDYWQKAVDCLHAALEVLTPELYPVACRYALQNLGNAYFDKGLWGEALAAYQRGAEVSQSILAMAYTESGRQSEVGKMAWLFSSAAYCLLKLKRHAEALIVLDSGKTRLLAEALALSEAETAALTEAERRALREAREKVLALEAEMRLPPDAPSRRPNDELGRRLGEARAGLNEVIKTLRRQHSAFMPARMELADVLALIPDKGAIVAPVVSPAGTAVLVVPHGAEGVGEEHLVEIDDFKEDYLYSLLADRKAQSGWLIEYLTWRSGGPGQRWMERIEEDTALLWRRLMGPVHRKLKAQGVGHGAHVVVMPQGGLGLLPLHAAWRRVGKRARAFVDDYTVSYSPSAYVLGVSRRWVREERRQRRSLTAVINPTGDLPFASVEGAAVAALFPEKELLGEGATAEALIEKAAGAAYLHCACHGSYDIRDVARSSLLLGEGTSLSLSQIISHLDLGAARLVTLSACETGLTEASRALADQYVGLPAGFLLAGAPGVVSSLWAVNDLSTMLLMERFYTRHLDGGGRGRESPAAALREAQLWLREVSAEEVIERFNPARYEEGPQQPLTYEEVSNIWLYFLTKKGEPSSPFSRPFYWAAFTFSGS